MSRPVAILLFVGIYVALAFGLRSYLQYRRTGTTGFRGISGRPFSIEWIGSVMFVLAMIATVAAPLLVWGGIERTLLASTVAVDITGGVALGTGTLALLWSQGAMGSSWRIGVDQREVTGLVTEGPFAVVRNPIFSAMLLSVFGLVLLLPTVTALAAFVLLLLAVELQVRFVEEPYLVRTHADAYRSYARRVGRFVPWLGKLAVVFVALAALAGCSDEVYSVERLQDPATCMECHPKHYQQWSGSMHAYASDDPVFVAMNNRGQRETNGKLGDFCVSCHAPLAVALGFTDGQNFDPAALPPHVRGITCYFCHNVKDVTSTHNNGLVLANDQTMRGGLKNPVDNPAHRSSYDKLMDSDINQSEMCGSCHDIVVPASINGSADVALERTFAEWQTTIFAKDTPGIHLTCGTCHMPSSTDVIADAPGIAVKSRENGFHEHMWPAIDQALTPFPEVEAQAAGIKRDLDPSIGIVGPLPLSGPPAPGGICVTPENGGQITVRVDAFGTGHMWPSGAAQDRRTWLEMVAYDASDNIILQTGVVPDRTDPEDIADPNLFGFWDRTFKADGSPAHFFWDVARVDSQLLRPAVTFDKLDPAYDHSVTKRFPIPGRANDVERIVARFRVRALPFALLADLVASGDLAPSVVDALPTLTVGGTEKTWERATRITATGCSQR